MKQGMKEIVNPILHGSNPDPSVLRVGDDYYIATSTFEWFPGIRIHHSKDLVNWRLLASPLSRLSQLDMEGDPDSCGIWAPNLTWKDGIFYLVYSHVRTFDGRWKDTYNYLVTAGNPDGPWSEPVYLNGSGFDPSLFHDDDGRAWVTNLLVDHRKGRFFGGIVLQEYSYSRQELTGDIYHIFTGTELGVTEGPVIMKKDGWYYLITAEGGTEYGHAVTVARSRDIKGPYEVHPANPVLTSSLNPHLLLQKAGHGSMIEAHGGFWYLSHLAGRPLTERGRCPLGRETALQQIVWRNGWPWLAHGGNEPEIHVKVPDLPLHPWPSVPLKDDFDSPELGMEYQSLRIPADDSWLSLKIRPGFLALRGQESLCSTRRQSLIARRQEDFSFEATAELQFSPETFQQMAGIVYYYNTRHFFYFYKSWEESCGGSVLNILVDDNNVWSEPLPSAISTDASPIWLKIRVVRDRITFFYSEDGNVWTDTGTEQDASIISDDYVRDKCEYKAAFTGAFVGLACQDLSGKGIWAYFDSFEYKPIIDVG